MRLRFTKIEAAVVVGILFLLVSLCLPWLSAVTETPFRLLFGWVPFLRRAVPRVTVSPTGVATFALLLAASAGLAHRSGRRLFPRGEGRGWSWRSTAAACGLLIGLFAAGLAATGFGHQVGWLVRSPVPLTEGMSTIVRRLESENNLKQIGLGLHNYHLEKDRFPAGGTFAPSGRGEHGWMTRLLPYLDVLRWEQEVTWDEPWDAPVNRNVFARPHPAYTAPYPHLPERNAADYALAHYAGNARVLTDGTGLRLEEIADGATNTLLAGGVNAGFRPWAHPANTRDPAVGLGHAAGFGGPREGGVTTVVFADGRATFLSADIDPAVLKALSTPAGGEAVDPGDF